MGMPGPFEWVIILAIVLVVFGAGKLPKVGRALGTAISEFKDSLTKKENVDPKNVEEKKEDRE